MVDEGNDHIEEMDISPRGHLQLFHKVWLANEYHPRVAHILKQGYKILLKSPIELSRNPKIHSGNTNQQKRNFLLECVDQMLQKKAIIPVRMCASLGFHSRLFLVPKPGEKWRPVVGFECVKQPSVGPNIQNGDSRSDKELHLQWGVGSSCRADRRLFSYPHISKVSKSFAISCGRSFFSIR